MMGSGGGGGGGEEPSHPVTQESSQRLEASTRTVILNSVSDAKQDLLSIARSFRAKETVAFSHQLNVAKEL